MQKVLQKVSYFVYDIIINEIKLERQLFCCSPSFSGQKACWGQLLEVSMLLTTSENLFHQGREWPFIPIMQLFFNHLALQDAVGCIAACCSPLRVHTEFLCFYTWIDWLCRSKACLDTCGTQRTSHSNVESQNQAELGQKRWSWLHSIQTLERFICSENITNPVARTNSLDMCCLATGTKKMSGHSG